ncbi:MAG: L-fucose/L-arabinose isomerase family protein [Draconibacterium sp.]
MVKIGLFGIGLDTYWPQFQGLQDRLIGYQNRIKSEMELLGVEIVDAGLVDSVDKAVETGLFLNSENVELLFLYISTYALSSTVLPIVQRVKVPVVILNLQPVPAIDYEKFNQLGDRGKMTGEWLAHCQACSVPEIAGVFNRAEIKYDIVTGYLDDKNTWKEIGEWIDASKVAHGMRNNRLGVLGHYYNGMLDVYSDLARQTMVFGTHIELLEMCELHKYRSAISDEEIQHKTKEFYKSFEVSIECEQFELDRAAKTAIALDKLVESHKLGSMAYYYEGEPGNEYEDIVTSVIAGNTLLTGNHIPVAGECEVKNAQAMKIMDLFDAGGSFSEFYAMDFNDDIVMLGHDGPAHYKIAEGKVKLVPLPVYHGKPGKGLSVQMEVKHGPVTLLSVVDGKEGLFFLVAEGESVPGPTLKIGNTNSRYRFSVGAKDFINQWSKHGPAHHCAIGTGHILGKIKKLASLFDIPVKVVG